MFDRELPDAEVVISQPFWPAYLTAERIAKAQKLKLAITAGIGSDHVDLDAAIRHGVTVAEVTYCNSISVAEHVVMMILSLVRNYLPSLRLVLEGGWNIADCVARSYDLEGMEVGTVAAGRIGLAVLRRLKPFDVQAALHRPAPPCQRRRAGAGPHLPRRRSGAWCRHCDVVTINAPLHPETEGLFDDALIGHDEARRLPGQHRPRQDLRPGRRRPGAGERSAGRLRGRRLVPAAGTRGPSLADHAAPRHDPAHLGLARSRPRPGTPPARGRSSSAGSPAARSATST